MRTTVIVGAGFSAALTAGHRPMIGHSPLPVLSSLGPALLSHLRTLASSNEGAFSAFPRKTIDEGIGVLKAYFGLEQPPYDFEQFMSLLAFRGALLDTGLKDVYPDVVGSDDRVLPFILHVLYDYFARAMAHNAEPPPSGTFWYQVNDKGRLDAFREGLHLFFDVHDTTFISFNYDGILEALLDKPKAEQLHYVPALSHGIPLVSPERMLNNYAPPNLSRFEGALRVIKPHGSMHFFELRDDMHQLLGGPRIAAIHPGLISDFDPAKQVFDLKRHRAWDYLRPTPLIVPPVLNKEAYLTSTYFREMLGLTYQAVARADRIVVLGFSLPASDLHMGALFEAVNWNGKQVSLCYRAGPSDTTEQNWRRVARSADISVVTDEGIDVSSLETISSFWASVA